MLRKFCLFFFYIFREIITQFCKIISAKIHKSPAYTVARVLVLTLSRLLVQESIPADPV